MKNTRASSIVISLITTVVYCTSNAQELPLASCDLRDHGILTPVKHQMECGSCGEFAAIAVLEALIKKETGQEVDLSEQQIVSCVPGCGCLTGCSSLDALRYMRREGVALEEDFPYENADRDCIENLTPKFYVTEVFSTVIDGNELGDRIVTIKNAVMEYGPVATNMALYADLDSYKDGIYSYDGEAEALGGHWVCIVGWKDDPEMASGGYWICRNSWGENWGDKGYFLSAYGDETGIDDFYIVAASFDPAKNVSSEEREPVARISSVCPGDPGARQLTFHEMHDYHATWLPEGRTLIFTSQRSGVPKIWMIPESGDSLSLIETGIEGDHHFSLFPDGKTMAVDGSVEGGFVNIWTVSTEGVTAQPVLKDNAAVNVHPVVSPDGTRIAFGRMTQGAMKIWTCDVSGDNLQQITFDPSGMDFFPKWTPDGKNIAFTSDRSGNEDLWMISVGGGTARQLTNDPGTDNHVAFSPDGMKIAYSSERGGKRDIWIMPVEGGNSTRLTETETNIWPSWSPDGKRIAYSKMCKGNLDIWVIEVQGRMLR